MVSKYSSKQGRMIEDIDQDARVILFTATKVTSQENQPEDQLEVLSAANILADATRVHTYSRRRRAVSTGRGGVSTASRIISIAEETDLNNEDYYGLKIAIEEKSNPFGRRLLKLEDSDGISTLLNTEIFKQLALMGYASNSDKLTFQKGYFSPQW
nr:hypothetical protein [Tanacetum cinerariifolium]